MRAYVPNIAGSERVAVAAASAGFTTPMKPGQVYLFTANTNCWVKVTTTGGSAVADTSGNMYVHAGQTVYLSNLADFDNSLPSGTTTTNGFVKVIRDSADGDATLTPMVRVFDR